jgi:hypothetical protein
MKEFPALKHIMMSTKGLYLIKEIPLIISALLHKTLMVLILKIIPIFSKKVVDNFNETIILPKYIKIKYQSLQKLQILFQIIGN